MYLFILDSKYLVVVVVVVPNKLIVTKFFFFEILKITIFHYNIVTVFGKIRCDQVYYLIVTVRKSLSYLCILTCVNYFAHFVFL